MTAAQPGQRPRQRRQPAIVEHAHNLVQCTGRVRQRPQQVENGPNAHFPPGTDRIPHGTMVNRREHEPDTGPPDTCCHLFRRQINPHAGRFQYIGTAGASRHRAITVFGDPGAGRGGDQGAGRGNVERPFRIPARTAGIHQPFRIDRHFGSQIPHDLRRCRDFIDRLPFHAQTDEKTADLGRCCLSLHDHTHHGGHLPRVEIAPLNHAINRFLHIHYSYPPS